VDFVAIASGIGAGVTYSLTAWGKKKGQPFDAVKFGTTVIIGALSGLAFGISGVPFDVTTTYLANLGVVPVVENILKTVWRKVLGKTVWRKIFGK